MSEIVLKVKMPLCPQPPPGGPVTPALQTFYRVLYTRENREAWERKDYHSGHMPPSDWFRMWEDSRGSLNPADYPLNCSTGYYSEAARGTFLNAAKNGRVRALTTDEAKKICEQAGVSAYPTPAGAFTYLLPGGPPRRLGTDRYVEFRGRKLADDNVEGGGAVIACVVETDGRMLSRAEFARAHHLQAE
jgi:hypothetical protein